MYGVQPGDLAVRVGFDMGNLIKEVLRLIGH